MKILELEPKEVVRARFETNFAREDGELQRLNGLGLIRSDATFDKLKARAVKWDKTRAEQSRRLIICGILPVPGPWVGLLRRLGRNP